MFITFEGCEGAGKSTQVKLLAERIRSFGRRVLVTREPGGHPNAESIRKLLVEGEKNQWLPTSEALLIYAARNEHYYKTIRPALDVGYIVICDRFIDSTIAYQGYGGGLDIEWIVKLHSLIFDNGLPDFTFILNISPEEGLTRAAHRSDHLSRFEKQNIEFHQRVQQGFLEIAAAYPERCTVLDATCDIPTIGHSIWQEVQKKI